MTPGKKSRLNFCDSQIFLKIAITTSKGVLNKVQVKGRSGDRAAYTAENSRGRYIL